MRRIDASLNQMFSDQLERRFLEEPCADHVAIFMEKRKFLIILFIISITSL